MHADKSLKSVNVISVELASWFFIITSLIVKSVDRNDAQVVCQSLGGYSGLGPRSFIVQNIFSEFSLCFNSTKTESMLSLEG